MQFVANVMLKRLLSNASGTVLVEFAMTLPVLLMLLAGGSALSDMIACNRKVTLATRTLSDLVSRTISPSIVYNNPSATSATAQLSASAVILNPYRLDNATQEISLLRVCDATHAYVVWSQAQTQNSNGSTVTSATPTQTAGTLPTGGTQTTDNIVTIPSNMVTGPMIPTSPDGSNVCQNLNTGTSTKTQVGTAGGYLFRGTITYNYSPSVAFVTAAVTPMTDTIYMVPRLF
ncbi:MAG: pilus assembly protein [Betaproteobacteria bacterium]|nr:pilus assembly protein [Betaproteobacteria bacterium]